MGVDEGPYDWKDIGGRPFMDDALVGTDADDEA